MDRKTALHILESLGPEVDPTAWAATADIAAGHEYSARELTEVEQAEQQIAAAAGLLAEDPLLASEFALRQQWDRQIARAMIDVPVPVGLKQRLLDSLAEASSAEAAGLDDVPATQPASDPAADRLTSIPSSSSAAAGSAAQPVGSSRRFWLRTSLATSAALLLGTFAWWSALPRPVQFELARLQRVTVDDLNSRPAFEGQYTATLPAGWEYSDLHLAQSPQAVLVGEAAEPVAGYAFQVNTRRLGTIRGVLLVVPVELLDSPVENTSIDGPVSYVTSGETVYTTVAWREGPLAYICLTAGGDNAMRFVRQAVKGDPA
ncbi:MAG: hypothetical protein KDA79_09850 [Planctomycetaceae bacterium]|nr:hypothetical protein [Planctomycetaceae bacterium]